MMTLVYLTIAWSLGIILGRQLDLPPIFLASLTAVGFIGVICYRRTSQERLAVALLVAALLGGWRHHLAQPRIDETHLAHYNDGGEVSITGYVSADPSVRDTYTQLEIAALRIEADDVECPIRGRLVANVGHYPRYEYGDLLRVKGNLETPPVLDTFSYKEYLAARGVHSLTRYATVESLDEERGSRLLRAMFRAKQGLRTTIERILPNPEAGLLSGILLGLGHTLPDDLDNAFRTTGLTHIIVISGFNISLVIQAVMLSSHRLLHRWWALGISLAVVALYALFVGATPPVVRAALMGCVFVVGQLVGRPSHPLTSLAAASLLMTLWNPLILWSVSFQLSLAATLALLVIEPVLTQGVYGWMTPRMDDDNARRWLRLLRDVLLTTVAAQILTLPIIWHHFRSISLISLLANLLVLSIQPAVMAFGALATLLGVLWLPLGRVAAWTVWPLLRYNIGVVRLLARIPGAAVDAPALSTGGLWALYGMIAVALVLAQRERRERIRDWLSQHFQRSEGKGLRKNAFIYGGLLVLVLIAVLIWSAACTLPDGNLHLYALDVGQGDALLLRTPGGRVILVDGGPDPLTLTSHLGRILPFWQRKIDLVVATHGDKDHLAGLVPVVERYRVGYVLEPANMGGNALIDQWHASLRGAHVTVLHAARGQRLHFGKDLTVEVLHPPADAERTAESDDNENSVVLRVRMGRCVMLLTGDIGAQTEEQLLHQGLLSHVTLLKVAHHGSNGSTSRHFVSTVSPEIAVISVGADNRLGHPSDRVLQELQAVECEVLRTDLHGTIEYVTDGRRSWIKRHDTLPRKR
ncbi:MAG: DNA internalization-related competence protein ComEC/Rec2 [Chloroflexota bacterium]|nr:DNA internalization-related competence protein ComEC/Rec2 [Chloroflexota bacterium]